MTEKQAPIISISQSEKSLLIDILGLSIIQSAECTMKIRRLAAIAIL